jgi:hypothetical protein
MRNALIVFALVFMTGGGGGGASAQAVAPDPTVTPGAIRTTDTNEICSTGTRRLRRWSRERDDRILAEYGLPPGPHPDYEIDHLIPLGLGGADDDLNLWPEMRRSLEPVWSAERKDRLEWRLRELVCAGALDVRTAQQSIADDWIEAYRRYVSSARPLRRRRLRPVRRHGTRRHGAALKPSFEGSKELPHDIRLGAPVSAGVARQKIKLVLRRSYRQHFLFHEPLDEP